MVIKQMSTSGSLGKLYSRRHGNSGLMGPLALLSWVTKNNLCVEKIFFWMFYFTAEWLNSLTNCQISCIFFFFCRKSHILLRHELGLFSWDKPRIAFWFPFQFALVVAVQSPESMSRSLSKREYFYCNKDNLWIFFFGKDPWEN